MLLDRRTWFVKERAGLMKLADVYDILDPETQQVIGIAKEEPGSFIKILRLVLGKQLLPTAVNIYESEGAAALLSIRKPISFLRAKVQVFDHSGTALGYFKSKLFSLGGGFWIHDTGDRQVAEVKGDWKGWNFKFLDASGRELGTVTKKWAGIGKELFTSADNYIIALSAESPGAAAPLLLAAGLAIDLVLKERE